ncbi:MAG: PhzF family phenazine biosynthesis isomerase [Microthrixaceae bacterium]
MVDVPYLLLDVFTQTQFEGNPLAVVIDPPPLTDGQMANIAREFNLSETIFLGGVGGGRWTTRIFTPAHELPFAGHPTVGGTMASLTGRAQPSPDLTAPTVVLVEGAGDVPVGIVPTGQDCTRPSKRRGRRPSTLPIDRAQATAVLNAVGLEPSDVC